MAIFKKSALELKNIRCLVVTALLIALELIIKQFTIKITPDLKISFAFLAKASIGMLYGPTVSFLSGLASDVIGFLIKPSGTFSPLFTLQEGFAGMLYGLFLYRLRMSRMELHDKALFKKSFKENGKQIARIVLGKLAVTVGINLFYTPLALIATYSMEAGEFVYGSVLMGYPKRLLKNAIQYPVDCVMLMLVLPMVATAYYMVFKGNNNNNNKQFGET